MAQDPLHQINYLNARRKYERARKKVLSEQRWEPQSGTLFSIFVEPFKDALKGLKLAAMDFSNVTRLLLGTLWGAFKNDPKSIQKTRENYDERRSRLKREWEPITKNSLDAINSADPLLTMMLAPNFYLASKGTQAAVAAGKTAAEIITANDWDVLIDPRYSRVPDEKWGLSALFSKLQNLGQDGKDKKPGPGDPLSRPGTGLLQDLQNLFYGAAENKKNEARQDEPVLQEQDGGEKLPTDPAEYLKQLFAVTGMQERFDETLADAAFSRYQITAQQLEAVQEYTTLAKIVAAKNPKELDEAVKSSGTKGASQIEKAIQTINSQTQEQARQMAQSEEFRNELAQKQKKNPQDLNDNEVLEAATSTVFVASKGKMDEDIMSKLMPGLKEIEETQKEVNLDERTLSLMSQRASDVPEVKDLLDVYKKEKSAYDQLQKIVREIR